MELWTGLVCLMADPACKNFRRFGDGQGAYVNVVAWAESAKHFEQRVTAIAREQLDCVVQEVENVELLEAVENLPDELLTMRTTAEKDPNNVVFGTFHLDSKRCELSASPVKRGYRTSGNCRGSLFAVPIRIPGSALTFLAAHPSIFVLEKLNS